MPCSCWYFIILYSSMFLTICYFDVEEIFLLEPKGRRGRELGPLLLFNPLWLQSPNFKTFKEPNNWFQGTNSGMLCSMAGRYDNPIPTRLLTLIDCLKIPALDRPSLYLRFKGRLVCINSPITLVYCTFSSIIDSYPDSMSCGANYEVITLLSFSRHQWSVTF
jgi:hypothetical protein